MRVVVLVSLLTIGLGTTYATTTTDALRFTIGGANRHH